MVIDSSALIAILLDEPQAATLSAAIAEHPNRCMSAFALLETAAVLERRKGHAAVRELDALIADLGIETVAFDTLQARIARTAYGRFGKGVHPAGLNLGDCCSYALARTRGEPLLFKGGDFTRARAPTAPLPPDPDGSPL